MKWARALSGTLGHIHRRTRQRLLFSLFIFFAHSISKTDICGNFYSQNFGFCFKMKILGIEWTVMIIKYQVYKLIFKIFLKKQISMRKSKVERTLKTTTKFGRFFCITFNYLFSEKLYVFQLIVTF